MYFEFIVFAVFVIAQSILIFSIMGILLLMSILNQKILILYVMCC